MIGILIGFLVSGLQPKQIKMFFDDSKGLRVGLSGKFPRLGGCVGIGHTFKSHGSAVRAIVRTNVVLIFDVIDDFLIHGETTFNIPAIMYTGRIFEHAEDHSVQRLIRGHFAML
jgi:hypothetical protein